MPMFPLSQEEINRNKRIEITNKFSDSFKEKTFVSPHANSVLHSLMQQDNPYFLLESLIDCIISQQKEIEKLVENVR